MMTNNIQLNKKVNNNNIPLEIYSDEQHHTPEKQRLMNNNIQLKKKMIYAQQHTTERKKD